MKKKTKTVRQTILSFRYIFTLLSFALQQHFCECCCSFISLLGAERLVHSLFCNHIGQFLHFCVFRVICFDSRCCFSSSFFLPRAFLMFSFFVYAVHTFGFDDLAVVEAYGNWMRTRRQAALNANQIHFICPLFAFLSPSLLLSLCLSLSLSLRQSVLLSFPRSSTSFTEQKNPTCSTKTVFAFSVRLPLMPTITHAIQMLPQMQIFDTCYKTYNKHLQNQKQPANKHKIPVENSK